MDGSHSEYLFDGVTIIRADRSPCPVCGHPTGDCAGEQKEVTVIGLGIFKSLDQKLFHIVDKDVYEERQINPFYTARVLLAKAGQKISVDRARELGLL